MAKDIDKRHFDYISTHFYPMDMVATLSHTPHILHDHGLPQASLISSWGEFKQWVEVNSFRLVAARKAAIVMPISEYMGREFRRKYLYGGKMDILPSGIEFPSIDPEPIDGFGKYVLYVGRHTPYKGVHKLIKIFGEAKKELGDDVHLVTIGNIDKGKYGDSLRALASSVGNVHMLGFVPDVWPYYAGATAYATCSAWEGEDRPVLEAQYMRKPAISYNNCSHPEVVFYGDLANNDDEFRRALIRRLSDSREDPGVRQKVVDRFATRNTVGRYMDIVKKYRGES
jgi:glycosyltransferase involved in cell wall biosynthesis